MLNRNKQNELSRKTLFLVLTCFFVIFGSWQIFHGSIVFHTDIARDFMLLDDVINTKKPTLIGPRSGGIPGVFHGPLWLYVNLPVFLLSQGNPLASGWFWIFLFILGLWTTYQVGRMLFSKKVGLTAALLVAISASGSIPSLFNPFGAVILSPVCFYFFLTYLEKSKVQHLLLYLFFIGLVVQFQMAFGLPILLITLFPLVIKIIKQKKYLHLLCFFILFIPLSTFILFDLRHQFLQIRSVLNYVSGIENAGKLKIPFILFFLTRMKDTMFTGAGMFVKDNFIAAIIVIGFYIVNFVQVFRKKETKKSPVFFYFLILYFGYWILTLVFKGTIWGYYYWPFLPLVAIITAYFIWRQSMKITFIILSGIVLFNGFFLIQGIIQQKENYVKTGSWLFYYDQAKKIYEDVPHKFGYYIYTADQYGYSSRYAMDYAQKKYTQKRAIPFEKQEITYLIIFPSTNPFTNEDWWKKNQVKIDRKPNQIFQFNDGSYIEKYILSSEEQKIKSDDNLIHSLIFR